MIWFYSGTPGSGKSLHVAKDIYARLSRGKDVIASFPIDLDAVRPKRGKKLGRFVEVELSTLNVNYLINYARNNHVGKEGETLVVLDECQIIFNPREFSRKDRLEWITFFTQHRKLGYNFILISQFDRLVDRQIRSLFEYEVKHRKVNNFKLGRLFPCATFCAIEYWYGVRERISSEIFFYKKKYGKLYDTFMFFDDSIKSRSGLPARRNGGNGGPMTEGGLDQLIDEKEKNGELEIVEIPETESLIQKISGFFRRKKVAE